MPETDFHTVNPHYLEQLLQLAASREVLFSDDVFADNGGKLAGKGSPLTPPLRAVLLASRLKQPLERSLLLPDYNALHTIKSQARDLLARFPLLQALFQRAADRNACLAILETLPLNPALDTYLALLQHSQALEHHVGCCLLSIGIARLLGLPGTRQHQLALAALLHDVGMLYLPPAGHPSPRALPLEDWRQLVNHPLIAYHAISAFGQLPQVRPVALAILQHHERLDGSGYPARSRGEQVELGGQVLLVADTVSQLLLRDNASLPHVDIALKLQPGEFNYDIVSALSRLIRQLDAPAAGAPSPEHALHQLLHHIGRITQQFWYLKDEEERLSDAALALLDNSMQRFNSIQSAVFSTGAGEIEDEQRQDDTIRRELNCVVAEVRWRLRSLAREIALQLGTLSRDERGDFLELARQLMPDEDAHD